MDALKRQPLWVSFGLNPGGAGTGPWRSWRAVARQYCIPTTPTDDVTSATGPCGLRSAPPVRTVGRAGWGPASATAPGRRSKPGPAPPARAPLGRKAGWSNGGSLPCLWAVRQCATVSSFERQLGCLLVCWSVGGLLAVLIRGPVGRVGIVGDGSRTSMAAGGSPVGADSVGQQAACRSYEPSPGPCPRGRHACRKPLERPAGGHVSQAGGRRWSGGGSRGAPSSVSRPTGPEGLGPVAVRE
jgi:hypothetical protein